MRFLNFFMKKKQISKKMKDIQAQKILKVLLKPFLVGKNRKSNFRLVWGFIFKFSTEEISSYFQIFI